MKKTSLQRYTFLFVQEQKHTSYTLLLVQEQKHTSYTLLFFPEQKHNVYYIQKQPGEPREPKTKGWES